MKKDMLRNAMSLATALVVLAASGMAKADGGLPELMDRDTVKAIERGLGYLARTQRQDGGWLNSGGYGTYPQVMTALSGLAMMASGSTPEGGKYSKNVRKAMLYTIKVAKTRGAKDGLIAGGGAEQQSMYGHGFSMLFLAECYGMEINTPNETSIREVLDAAIKLTCQSQSNYGPINKNAGGWIYTPTGGSDEGSVTVTQLQPLRACRNVGIKVPKDNIDRAVYYLKMCQQADGGICYSFQSRGGGSRPPISAAGIACFYSAGVYDQAAGGAGGEEAKMIAKLVDYCKQNLKVGQDNGHYFYSHLYYAQAMYQRGGIDEKAKKEWTDYYNDIRRDMLSRQSADGSWNGDSVGTTYGTAIACIILQLPYGYLPIYQR
jgi:hypothetical protein